MIAREIKHESNRSKYIIPNAATKQGAVRSPEVGRSSETYLGHRHEEVGVMKHDFQLYGVC